MRILKLLEVQHLDKDGNVLWEDKNISNMMHKEGEEYLLRVAFAAEEIPVSYYVGLDNRTTVTADDSMGTITTEPAGSGYLRQPVLSTGEFAFSLTPDGNNKATTPILTFLASGGSWGPVRNAFLTTQSDSSGFLLASIPLSTPVTLLSGEEITLKISLALKDCP